MKDKKTLNIEYICVTLDGKKRCVGLKDLIETLTNNQDDPSSSETCCAPNCC